MPTVINPVNGRAVYSCAEWGAAPAAHAFDRTTPKVVVVHHMDWPNRPLITDPAKALVRACNVARSCQQQHMVGNGWADTGQNFTVTRDGIVLEGRHGSLMAALHGQSVRAAHAADPDTGADANDSPGIECEGTYSTATMPAPQWAALLDLCAWLCHQDKIDSTWIIGHRDTGCRTECPGNWLESQLPALRAAVHNRLVKQPAPKPQAPERDDV